jgi:hypothetical protein
VGDQFVARPLPQKALTSYYLSIKHYTTQKGHKIFNQALELNRYSNKLRVRWIPGNCKTLSFTASTVILGPTQRPICGLLVTLSPGIKRQESEAHHAPHVVNKFVPVLS